MSYDVFVTLDDKEDLEGFIYYLLVEKKSRQAAMNVLDDFEATKPANKSQELFSRFLYFS